MSQAATAETLQQLDDRDAAALTSYMTVVPIADADDLYDVTSDSGSTYRVDLRFESCECGDARHRDPEGGCKHVRRAAFATGRREIPEWVDRDAVDPQLGEQIDLGTEFHL
jgi:hypothetical protein